MNRLILPSDSKLSIAGATLFLLAFIYFFIGGPVFAYSGPDPSEASARFMMRVMIHLMICLPSMALGAMWMWRGRKSGKA